MTQCPECTRFTVKRSRRRLWDKLVSLANYYPFRCQYCNHRFYALREDPAERLVLHAKHAAENR